MMRKPSITLFIMYYSLFIFAVCLSLVPQPPTITLQSPKDYIFDPREPIVIHCEAKGKPHPSFSWTRNGTHFDIEKDSKVTMKPNSGTLVIDIISGEKAEAYEGTYQCTAHNNHGTAVSNNIVIRQSRSPLWSKEKDNKIVVQMGNSLVLQCRPPAGLPPPIIMWMDNNLQRLSLSPRVSQAVNGDLYFSNVLLSDTRTDYICYARFPRTQTIQQKQPISVTVLEMEQMNETWAAFYNMSEYYSGEYSPIGERKPGFMMPLGPTSTQMVLKGETLVLECIAEGLPTPNIMWQKDGGSFPNHYGSAYHIIKVTVKAAPFWISAPRNLILAPNETGILTCRVSGEPKPKISWFINGVPLQNAPEDRSRKVEDDTVILSNVQTGTSAVYQCNASNEFGYVLANAFVNVLAEPPRVLTPPNRIYQVITNNHALLDCASFGSPSEYKDGDPYVIHENGTLEIHVAQPLNTGKYTCIATNNLGIKENHVFLEVKEPTRILKQPEYKVVKARPFSHTHHDWLKDSAALPNDDSLVIKDVVDEDEGTYACHMNTTLDHDSASAMLTVVANSRTLVYCVSAVMAERPDPPADLELTGQAERSVELTWTPGDEHNSLTQKFIVQYEDLLHRPGVWVNLTEVPGTSPTTQLNLSPYVYYSFRVVAVNGVGYSDPSQPSRQYRTNPAAPDENPSDVKGEGSEPGNLVISWTPLTGLQSNGPGLEYRVQWKQKDVEEEWSTKTVANVSQFVVSGTPTYVPYEIKVQAINNYGTAPEPDVAIGYSGEDLPLTAPDSVQIMVHNSTVAEVHWEPVSFPSVRGKLQGYKVKQNQLVIGKQFLLFSGNRSEGRLPGLQPYSLYQLHIKVLNSKGEGPASASKPFETKEGVPGPPSYLNAVQPSLDSLTLEWGPPQSNNGRLVGYTLKYQPVNSTSELGPIKEMTFLPNETTFVLSNLNTSMLYKFYLSAKTIKGSGPDISQEAFTAMDTTVANRQVDIATQGWFIGLMCAIALLILVLLIVCFIKRNKGGKYPVKEKEDAHQDPEIQPMKEDDGTFGEYSDTEDHKPLKGSRTPSNGTVRRDESDDSLVDYGEGGDGQFNEDGSFIGQYSGKKERDTHEGNESSEAPSPVNAMNSFV
uniref:Neuronal cell adhesion molecule a n=1 Tax=Neogobius melanostomus TaxID=47308 RepID=A0A8C6TU28_9GOBI